MSDVEESFTCALSVPVEIWPERTQVTRPDVRQNNILEVVQYVLVSARSYPSVVSSVRVGPSQIPKKSQTQKNRWLLTLGLAHFR